jgi:hypothetical protein
MRGGFYEREKQRAQGKQEGAAVEPQREEKVEEGEEEQVGWSLEAVLIKKWDGKSGVEVVEKVLKA